MTPWGWKVDWVIRGAIMAACLIALAVMRLVDRRRKRRPPPPAGGPDSHA